MLPHVDLGWCGQELHQSGYEYECAEGQRSNPNQVQPIAGSCWVV